MILRSYIFILIMFIFLGCNPPNDTNIDPGTTDPGTTDPGTTDPGTTDPGTTDPGTTDPGTTDPGITGPGSIPSSLRPENYNLDLIIGDEINFFLIAEYDDGTIENITTGFSSYSSNENTASVSGNSITALEMGTTYVTSSFRGVETTITVNVSPFRTLDAYRPSIESIVMHEDEVLSVNLQEVYDDGYIENIIYDVTYSVEDDSILSISDNHITALTSGTSRVNMYYQGKEYSVDIEVSDNSTVSNNRLYIFGHSLIKHEMNINPIPSDETSVPHWLYELAREQGEVLNVTGQYGFLRSHDNLPPDVQWKFDRVPGGWREYWNSEESFAEANFDTVLITAANFIQSNNPDVNYDGGGVISPLDATSTIFDWVIQEDSDLRIYIYENWETMNRAGIDTFPPTDEELSVYHANNSFAAIQDGGFHKWWLDYHDSLSTSYSNIKMIPVGPILSHLYTGILQDIPVDVLYEDEAPHGRPTTYFLAAMITYMALNEKVLPSTYIIPDDIHPLVRDNYSDIIDVIWEDLQGFTFNNGESRVFF